MQTVSFTELLPCPYCEGEGKVISHMSKVQGIKLYTGVCKKECDPRARTFAVKHKECCVELWNAANINVKRKTKGD